MAGYGITAHLICQSFNDVFSKYGEKTPLFDNMHITATFATSEPTSIEKVTRRAGKALEMRESYSDPRTLFGRAHRSTSQSEQQRYILSEEDVRGLDDRKQFLFVNNTKPILADKIRYYEEPFFRARAGDYFHGVPAAYEQRPGAADLPGKAHIDWRGVRAVQAAPPGFAGVSPPQRRQDGFQGFAGAGAEDLPPSGHLDPGEYLDLQPVGGLRHDFDDDDLSLS
jgi:type IV secretion system protein VirD4